MRFYGVLSGIFTLVRQFCLPNPFEALDGKVLMSPMIANLIFEGPLWLITFGVVKLYYIDRSEPVIGSILYMVFYAIHTGVTHLLCVVYPSAFLMVLVSGAYIAMHILLIMLRNRII